MNVPIRVAAVVANVVCYHLALAASIVEAECAILRVVNSLVGAAHIVIAFGCSPFGSVLLDFKLNGGVAYLDLLALFCIRTLYITLRRHVLYVVAVSLFGGNELPILFVRIGFWCSVEYAAVLVDVLIVVVEAVYHIHLPLFGKSVPVICKGSC